MSMSAQEYHRHSSYVRYEMGGGGLDMGSQPDVFKSYPGLEAVSLPQVMTWPENNLSSLARERTQEQLSAGLDLDRLARIVVLTHALTAKARYGGTEFYYRSVASAGALYPFELYLAVRNVSGLSDGLYHHTVGIHALTRLRSGNVLPAVSDAIRSGTEATPELAFFLTSIFYRSSWKYRDRAYRYSLLDTGHLAENLSFALKAARLPFQPYYDFDDRKINALLAVDDTREVCLVLVCVGSERTSEGSDAPAIKDPPRSLPEASRVSVREKTYPLIRQVHESAYDAARPAEPPSKMIDCLGLKPEPDAKIPASLNWPEVMTYAQAVFKRRSHRNFVPTRLSADTLWALLDLICSTPFSPPDGQIIAANSIAVGVLAGNVEAMEPGFHMLDLDEKSISSVKAGAMMEKMAHVCLDQGWLANCAVHFVFLADLDSLGRALGPRGYRYAMLTAGRLGQRIYLGATAMRIGCCGIGAFYDNEAASVLGRPDSTTLLYLVAAGPLKKWTNAGA